MLQETRFQVQVLNPCKFVQESSEKVRDFKSSTPSIYRGLKAAEARGSTASSIDGYLARFMKFSFSELISLQSVCV